MAFNVRDKSKDDLKLPNKNLKFHKPKQASEDYRKNIEELKARR